MMVENDEELIIKSLVYYARNHPKYRDRVRKELENWVDALPSTEHREEKGIAEFR